MPYIPHWKVVARFDLGGSTAKEQASCSLSFRGSGLDAIEGDQFLADDCFDDWRTWITTPAARVSPYVKLVRVTMYAVGIDGRITKDPVEAAGVPASGTADQYLHPWQCSVVQTLVAGTRGKGRFGRIYLPPQSYAITSDGLIDNGLATTMFATNNALLTALSDKPGLDAGWGLVVAGSTGPAGTLRDVTEVRMGKVADTQRRRRRSLDEAYLTAVFNA